MAPDGRVLAVQEVVERGRAARPPRAFASGRAERGSVQRTTTRGGRRSSAATTSAWTSGSLSTWASSRSTLGRRTRKCTSGSISVTRSSGGARRRSAPRAGPGPGRRDERGQRAGLLRRDEDPRHPGQVHPLPGGWARHARGEVGGAGERDEPEHGGQPGREGPRRSRDRSRRERAHHDQQRLLVQVVRLPEQVGQPAEREHQQPAATAGRRPGLSPYGTVTVGGLSPVSRRPPGRGR